MANHSARVAMLLFMACATVAAQPSQLTFHDARALYYAAEYEKALEVLDRLEVTGGGSDGATLALYRGASLFALGRPTEAERAFERVVAIAPDLRPEQLDLAPWLVTKFAAVRTRVLSVG